MCKVNILSKFIALFLKLCCCRIENTIINNKYFDEFLIRVSVNIKFSIF